MKKKIIACLLTCCCLFSVVGLAGCSQDITSHNIWVTSSNLQNGTVSGDGVYKDGEMATLRATPLGDNQFIAWAKNDIIVSKSQTYTFKVTSGMNKEEKYTALFSTETLDYMVLKSGQFEVNEAVTGDEFTLSSLKSASLAVSSTSALYSDILNTKDVAVSSLGTLFANQFDLKEKIFYLNKTYYFTFNANFEYVHSDGIQTKTEPIETKYYIINFNDLENGVIEDNVTTFSNNDVTLKLTQTVDSNTLEIQFKNINNASSWGENASQNFYITLKYPFEEATE